MTDRAAVHTGKASEQFLHCNITLILVHTVPEQLFKRKKTYLVQCEHCLSLVRPERFKHGRSTFLCGTLRELVCNGQLWASAVLRQLHSYKVGQREHFPETVWGKP